MDDLKWCTTNTSFNRGRLDLRQSKAKFIFLIDLVIDLAFVTIQVYDSIDSLERATQQVVPRIELLINIFLEII